MVDRRVAAYEPTVTVLSRPAAVDRSRRGLRSGDDISSAHGMTEETALAYDIAIEELPTRRMASVTLHATQTQLSGLIGRAFGTIIGALQATGTKPAGPPLVVFHDMIDDTTPGDVEVGIPVSMGTSGTSLGHDVAILSLIHI